jgi:hypothetical protein
MKDFFGDAAIAAVLTIGFVTTAILLHHFQLLYSTP